MVSDSKRLSPTQANRKDNIKAYGINLSKKIQGPNCPTHSSCIICYILVIKLIVYKFCCQVQKSMMEEKIYQKRRQYAESVW